MRKQLIKEAKKIIEYNCVALNITAPLFQISPPTEFATPTTQAATCSDGSIIIYNENYIAYHLEKPLQLWLCLSHECRHIWQARNTQWENTFNDYKNSSLIDLQAYNIQKPEIDAWAWASYFMNKQLKIKLLYDTIFSYEICKLINNRIEEIEKDSK